MRQGKYTVVSGKYVHSSCLTRAYVWLYTKAALCAAGVVAIGYAAYCMIP